MRAAIAAVLVLVLALPALGASPRRASLKLESVAPLVVSGKHFGAREPVLLTYLAPGLARKVVGVRAKPNGSFRVSFKLRVDRCTVFTIRAAGVRGSRAVLQVDPACGRGKGKPKRALAITLAETAA